LNHIRRLPSTFTTRIPHDKDGYIGRQCPNGDCEIKYFKITPGTGIPERVPCHCPYCGHVAEHREFFTKAQIEYARSVVRHTVHEALLKDLREAFPPRQRFGGGLLSLEITHEVKGHPVPVYRYREKDLETEIVCDSCSLRYAIYGLFGWCPDCGTHNSLQILGTNLTVAEKKLTLAGSVDPELAEHIVADALQTAVSAFDAFGRETCRAFADHATSPDAARSLSFQSIGGARLKVQGLFGFDLAACTAEGEWESVCKMFQKRHLFAHRGGVVDEAYLSATHDPAASLGRKVPLSADEVVAAVARLRCLGRALVEGITGQAAMADQSGPNGEM